VIAELSSRPKVPTPEVPDEAPDVKVAGSPQNPDQWLNAPRDPRTRAAAENKAVADTDHNQKASAPVALLMVDSQSTAQGPIPADLLRAVVV
jgi:hypothetical protein